jgi:hypothetical protein
MKLLLNGVVFSQWNVSFLNVAAAETNQLDGFENCPRVSTGKHARVSLFVPSQRHRPDAALRDWHRHRSGVHIHLPHLEHGIIAAAADGARTLRLARVACDRSV